MPSLSKNLYSSLKTVYAYNEFVKIVAEVTNLPVIKEAFTYGLDEIEDTIKEYNKLLYLLLVMVIPAHASKGHYTKDMQFREDVFNTFPYIDKTRAEVTPEDREKGLEFISDLNNFKGISAVSKPIYILSGCGD